MTHRLHRFARRALCRVFGHLPAQRVAGRYQRIYLAATICPRCMRIHQRTVGGPQAKREALAAMAASKRR